MAVWVLEPKDVSNEAWRGGRDDLARVVVVADTEGDARQAAANSRIVGHLTAYQRVTRARRPKGPGWSYDDSTPPGERSTLSPWKDRGASSCTPAEQFDDPIIGIEPEGMR